MNLHELKKNRLDGIEGKLMYAFTTPCQVKEYLLEGENDPITFYICYSIFTQPIVISKSKGYDFRISNSFDYSAHDKIVKFIKENFKEKLRFECTRSDILDCLVVLKKIDKYETTIEKIIC